MTPIGVTVITPAYRKVGREAVRRFKKFTGLDVIVLKGRDSDGFDLKLRLDQLLPNRPIVFFDADYWLLRKVDMKGICSTGVWLGVQDTTIHHPHCFPYKDCAENGLDKHRYINTGFFVCDLSKTEHRQVFVKARRTRKAYLAGKQKSYDHTDQFHINKGMEGIPLILLPLSYNFFTFASREGCCQIPREIIGLHGAGARTKEKYDVLMSESKVFGRETQPMWDDAVKHAYAMTYELR